MAIAVIGAVVAAGASAITARAASYGCGVTYTVNNQWPGGFGANVTVNNFGDPIDGWHLTWSFTAGQTVAQL